MDSLYKLDKTFRADLHCHSLYSDGSLSPEELIDFAVEKGLQALSITDHDTVDAYARAIPYAKQKRLLLGTGVEFSCTYKKTSVHALGYDFSLQDAGLHEYCHRQQKKRMVRNQEILEKLRRLSIIIEEEELIALHSSSATLGRPHIAAVMQKKGYVHSTQEAFDRYLGDRGCCFIPGEPFFVEEAASVVKKAGGKLFLAHPHLYSDSLFVKELLSLGFDGLECYYGRSPPRKEKQWLKIAESQKLLVSGGSDFHGSAKPHVLLGSSFVLKELFFAIFTNNLQE